MLILIRQPAAASYSLSTLKRIMGGDPCKKIMSQPTPIRRHLVSRILSPALQLWLRSQVDQVAHLQAQIEGGDRQILTGRIPQVSILAQQVVYQGLHLTHLELVAENIRFNLGQVLKGKALRLLEPVPVRGELRLREADLNASLTAPLLANAVQDFLIQLLGSELTAPAAMGAVDASPSAPGLGQPPGLSAPMRLQELQVAIAAERLTLSGSLDSGSGTSSSVTLRTGLQLASPQELQLCQPQWLPSPTARRGLSLSDLEGYRLDLGADVAFDHLSLEPGSLVCRGVIWVRP